MPYYYFGTVGDDIVNGSDYDDIIYGGSQDYYNYSYGDGRDTLYGNGGNDELYGGRNADILIGGSGNDRLEGGSGNDVYRFASGFGQDVVGYEYDGSNQLIFQDLSRAQASIQFDDSSLVITDSATGDRVIIDYYSYYNDVYTIIFTDGVYTNTPVAQPDSAITGEGSVIALPVLANDSDPDGDQLALVAINGGGVAARDSIDLTSGARVTLNADGTLGYDPNGAFDTLRTGEAAQDGFTYTIQDEHGFQATAGVTVTVQGADQPPTVVDDAASTTERGPVIIAVLANDVGGLPTRPLAVTAINGDALDVGETVTLASGAKVALNTDQTLSYDPNGEFVAQGVGEKEVDNFTYATADSAGNHGAASVAVTVTGLNDAPVPADDWSATDEETVITLKLLANDRDPDGDPLELREINGRRLLPASGIITLPSGATLKVQDDGAVTFDPRVGFDRLQAGVSVDDSFTYKIRDSHGGVNTALATVQVTGFSDPDVLVPQKPFNALEYTASYPDLIRAFGTDQAAATAHYETSGFGEGRAITFDGLEYIASYPDLTSAFGTERDAGSSHFISNGFLEERTTSFNAFEYIATFEDLIQAFGVDQAAGSTHYLTYGRGEGRSVQFDGLEYIAGYSDLRTAFGADEDAGAAHYIAAGHDEGRTIRFDGLQYIASHKDLIRAFSTDVDSGSRHYIQYGAKEHRSPDDFDEKQYLANYTDLQAAFGNDTEAATRHFITYGSAEDRTDEPLSAAADFLM